MTKRIIALLLALILTVGLLPTVALATEGDPTPDSDSTGTISGGTVQVAGNPKQSVQHEAADDPIHIKKSVSKGTDGKDYLTMEAYVTNPLEIKQEAVPIDIVLVLDVSGSMDDPLRNMNVPDFETYPNNMTNSDYLHYAQTGWGVYSAENEENKVNVTAADTYESVSRLTYDELKESGDNVSYYAKDNSGYHSLSIKKYWRDWWNYYLYMDGEHYQKVHDWNSPIQLSGYEIYKLKTTYTYTDKTGNVILTSTGPNNRPTNNGQVVTFYYYNGETQKKVKKIAALKEAANNFIDKVAEQKLPAGADGNAQYNRISIVKFAGKKSNNVGNDKYRESGYTHNYSQIVKPLTNVVAGGVTALQKAVNDLSPAGATRADYGMEKAQEALKDHGTRPSVVIMFTDGTPTKTDTFDAEVASNAVNTAKALKDAGTFVYTIAVYDGANPSEDPTKPGAEDFNKYLHAVSSNYPTATASKTGRNNFNVTFGNRVSSEKNYYFNATNAIGLNNVFETISREVSNLALVVDSTAVLSDTLSGYFSFDVDVATKAGITVKRVPVTGGNATDGFTWADINDTNQVTDLGTNGVEIKGKSIEVKNFDYGSEENAVTVHADGRVTGAKLVITFPIKPDDSETWTEGTVNYPTNSTTSPNEAGLGKYALKSDETNKNQKTQLTESPEIQIKAHKVTYVIDSTGYTGTVTAPAEKVYREGVQYAIEATPTLASGYKFTGWKDNDEYTGDDVTGSKPMGNTSVTYYGKIEKNEVKVDLAQYVKKTLTGNLPDGYKESFTAKITGTGITGDGLQITTDEFQAADTKPFNGMDDTKVDLTIGTEYVYTVTEVVPTPATPGMAYGAAVKFALKATDARTIEFYTVSDDGTKTKVDAAANQFVTIKNEYNPEKVTFSLANKFQKTLVSNVEFSKLPENAKNFNLNIYEGATASGELKAAGLATFTSLSKDNSTGKYTGSEYFVPVNGSTLVNELTFTEVGTYPYAVQESVFSLNGMKYDGTVYIVTFVVEDKGDGTLYIKSANVTKPGASDGETEFVVNLVAEGTDTLTITNEYTAATLPLDPTTDPSTGETTPKIVKELRVTGNDETAADMTFNVSVKDKDGKEVATGSAEIKKGAKDKATANFTRLGTLVFTKKGTYTYEVTESEANIAGVTCDKKTYTLTVEVGESNHVLSVSSARYSYENKEGTKVDSALPITITNTYTKPTYAVTKDVVEDPSITVPTGVDTMGYQYPTSGKFIVEKTYTDDTITFLYVIEVSGKSGAEMTIQEQDGGKFISVDYSTETRATINPNAAQDTYTVKLTADVDASNPIKLYAEKTFHKDADGKFPTTATNALLVNGEGGTKDDTTIEERGTLTVDFGALVHKHLTVTGDKSFNGATFTVNFTEGLYAPLAVNNSIEVYADAGVGKEKLPDLTASVTYTADERDRGLKDFDGADLTINTEGNYSYIVSEQIPAGATGYDAKKYVVGIVVVTDGDGLKVEYVWYHELVEDPATHPEILPGGPTFYNTIDTGKDDYYPIIIPTIIGKDTGMLNKTDHFAYVIGYPDGTVHPNGQITRAEVATIFFRLLRDEVRDGAFTTSNSYSDVAYGKWYNNPISTMSTLGIITGYPDGTFKPNKPITRAEFAAIAARFDETQSGKSATFSDVIGHWAAKEIGIAYYNDWIKGYPDGTFKPDQNITRAEAMTLINRVLERKPESPADLLTNMNKWTDNLDTSKWYYLDVQEATNSHSYTRKTFNYELWRQMLPDPDWSRYER